jgi:hypothetical protein
MTMKITVFWDVTSCSPAENNNLQNHCRENRSSHTAIFCVEDTLCNVRRFEISPMKKAVSYTLKVYAACFSETSVNLNQIRGVTFKTTETFKKMLFSL